MSHAEIRDAQNGEFYFVILANNGAVLATSETYKTKQGCHQAIASVYTIEGNVYSRQQTVDATKSADVSLKAKPEPQRPIGTVQEPPEPEDLGKKDVKKTKK